MKKKVLLLGAVSCVAGIVMAAGCSSSETVNNPAPDAASDAVSKADRVIPEAGEDDAGNCPINEPLSAADLEKDPGYKAGKSQPGACSTTDLAQFEKNLDDTTIKTWKDLEKDLTPGCAACIITSTAATNWGPVVYFEESGGDSGFYNFGACFGVLEKDDCGKAVQFLEFCLDAACDCATTQADRDTCIDKAADTTGMCADFVTTLQGQCKNLSANGKKCNNIGDAAKTICGPATGDAGDAGDADQ